MIFIETKVDTLFFFKIKYRSILKLIKSVFDKIVFSLFSPIKLETTRWCCYQIVSVDLLYAKANFNV